VNGAAGMAGQPSADRLRPWADQRVVVDGAPASIGQPCILAREDSIAAQPAGFDFVDGYAFVQLLPPPQPPSRTQYGPFISAQISYATGYA
jgi:hypothetical protein